MRYSPTGVLPGPAHPGPTGLYGSLGCGPGARQRGAVDVAGFAEAHVLARAGEHLADPVPVSRRRFRDIIRSTRARLGLPGGSLRRSRNDGAALAAMAEAQSLRASA